MLLPTCLIAALRKCKHLRHGLAPDGVFRSAASLPRREGLTPHFSPIASCLWQVGLYSLCGTFPAVLTTGLALPTIYDIRLRACRCSDFPLHRTSLCSARNTDTHRCEHRFTQIILSVSIRVLIRVHPCRTERSEVR